MKQLVLDANILMRGRGNLPKGKYLTTPKVAEELESQYSKNIFENRDIEIRSASKGIQEEVDNIADRIESPTSEEDNSIVALAMERESTVVSDDHGVQNLCLWLDVEFQGFMQDEIDEKREWDRVCVDCGNSVSGEKCNTCGSSNVERKPL